MVIWPFWPRMYAWDGFFFFFWETNTHTHKKKGNEWFIVIHERRAFVQC